MNASIKAIAVKMFGVAEHEVDEVCKALAALVEHGGATPSTATPGPSQEDFEALKTKVEEQQSILDDLTKPDPTSADVQGAESSQDTAHAG